MLSPDQQDLITNLSNSTGINSDDLTKAVTNILRTRRALVIEIDHDPQDPREYLPTNIWHPNTRSININTQDSENPLNADGTLRNGIAIAKPLYMLSHSGRSLSLSPFGDRWDSGQLGYVYLRTDQLESLHLTDATEEEMTAILQGDIKVIEAWMEGHVYRFSILSPTGEEIAGASEFYDLGDMPDALVDVIPQYTDDLPTDRDTAADLIRKAFDKLGQEIPYCIQSTGSDTAPSPPLWDNNLIQFARLLNEIELNLNLTDAQFNALQEAMDLSREEVQQLFDRAQTVFDNSKAKVPRGGLP